MAKTKRVTTTNRKNVYDDVRGKRTLVRQEIHTTIRYGVPGPVTERPVRAAKAAKS